jgi:hypothetical protein
MLSQPMSDRILAKLKERKGRAGATDCSRFLGSLITACLAGTDDDAHAENLFRLLDDYERDPDGSALARVLSGQVDLVGLVDQAGDRNA